jgi:hypothetical protein
MPSGSTLRNSIIETLYNFLPMRHIFLLLAVFLSAQVYGQYQYDEQRQKELNNYLESIRKGREYGNTKTSEFKMNEQAVQEMVDRWKSKPGKTDEQLKAERIAKEKALATKEEQMAKNQLRAESKKRKEVADILTEYKAGEFVKAGFTSAEANMMALLWVKDVKVNNEMQAKMVYHEWSSIIMDAYTEFLEKEKTGSFEELMALVDQFKYAGFTALKSLEKLQIRFPQKKTVIDFFIPFYGANFWKEFGYQRIGTEEESASAYLLSGDADKTEMNQRLGGWLKISPPLIKELEFIYRNSLTFKSLINDLMKKQDKALLHDIALTYALETDYIPETIMWNTQDIPSLKHLFTFEDFERIRKVHNISGVKAIEKARYYGFMKTHYDYYSTSGMDSALYMDELKKYADMGDAEAMNAYGLHTLKGHTKDAKEAAYPYLKRAADNGLPYALHLLAKYKNLKQLGIDNWGIYKRELEFKKEFNEEERVYLRSGSNQTPHFFGKEQPFTPDRKMKIPQPGKPQGTIYYYGSLKNGKADGYGYGIDASDNLYSGYWKDNQYNGPGELVTGDGHLYEGMFVNGKKNGYVYYNYQKKGDGPFHSGLYENDKLVEKGKKYRPLTGWRILADKEYNWNFSGIPADFENMRRRINADNILEFKSTDDGYSWAISDVNNYKPAAYSFEAHYKIDKKGYKNGTCGILIDIDEGNGKGKSKLLYMIHPGKQAFCLRLYNPNTDDWIYYTNPDPENGWLTSNFFRDYDNWVRLDKVGDEIFLYLNDKLVFTQNISTSGKPLHNFAGIGIVQGGMVSGTIPKIIFK